MPVDAANAKVTGVICSMRDASPTVKFLSVRVNDARFKFSAGQWVDFFAPGVEQIGGYSICSTPKQLEETGSINLLIKQSRYPPAAWIHNDAKPGAEVEMRVGGNFIITQEEITRPILFVAGGIGISPLYSMMRDAVEQSEAGLTVKLLYAARGKHEHCLVEALREVEELAAAKGGRVECIMFDSSIEAEADKDMPTRRSMLSACLPRLFKSSSSNRVADVASSTATDQSIIETDRAIPPRLLGRVSKLHLKQAMTSLEEPVTFRPATAFLCGPPKMSDAMEAHLLALGVPKERIRLERW
eukprot:CAMPEP_0198208158 /NCGR_PEP_ID=MMETSP1445-20131203/11548_1 /TAXON_ID=36898 /ORGANISM="Pyramimonas sp., Strain CCMP2087" /LENGTH=299 /DNA_ID=CAMNT_0043881447 /DNA_START=219 /DNA_END=1115 /DNA_ORIENTATION=+